MVESNSSRFRNPRRDLSGQRFGKLIATKWAGDSRWHCVCDCGGSSLVLTANLTRGNSTSCGCVRNNAAAVRNTIHGLTGTIVYKTWLGVRRRCRDKNSASYATYGAQGIDICDEWHDSIEAFFRDVGHPPSDAHTLDRIDNFKGYEPGNVRWATTTEQARNRRNCVEI